MGIREHEMGKAGRREKRLQRPGSLEETTVRG